MKLLTLLFLLSCGQVVAQKKSPVKKKEVQRPKPIGDSSWTEIQSDTLYGTIEYTFGGGKVTGDGMLVKDKFTHWGKPIYSKKDQAIIDSFRADTTSLLRFNFFVTESGYSLSSEDQKRAYIKTDKGWKCVQEQFTFKPK